jgi:hypothetical protein
VTGQKRTKDWQKACKKYADFIESIKEKGQ